MNDIINQINRANKIALFTHIIPDGDAIGSTFAFKLALEKMGKDVKVFINEKTPFRLQFLAEDGYFTAPANDNFDLCISLDCGDFNRLGDYKEMFESGMVTANIDHHYSNQKFAKFNYVDSTACSTGEIVFEFITAMNIEFNKEIANLVYAAIASDTGCFVFTNTGVKAHLYSAKLIEYGAEIGDINKLLFNTNDLNALKIRGYAINHIEFYKDNKIAAIVLTQDILKSLGSTDEDAEGLSDLPRSIRGVEVGLIIREWKGKSKVSIRTNKIVDASSVASQFGGGGHVRAAGCVTDKDVYTTRDLLVKKLEELV